MILAVCANPSVDSFWSVPALSRGTTNRSRAETYYPGGKGIHVAFALNELGQEVVILGLWGGQTGKWLKQQCTQKGITPIGPTVDQWNRLCLTMRSDTDWDETELLGHGPDLNSETATAFTTVYEQFVNHKNPEAVIMCGSVPAGLDDDTYHQLVRHAQKKDISTFVDASGSLLQQTLDAHPHSIHINLKEGRELSNFSDPIDIAKWLHEYCSISAVTAGKDGLYLKTKNQFLHSSYRLEPSSIISTIGSGDCLFAGLCLATLTHEEPTRWARFAAACGSANCIHPPLGMLKQKDVKTIVHDVTLNKITA